MNLKRKTSQLKPFSFHTLCHSCGHWTQEESRGVSKAGPCALFSEGSMLSFVSISLRGMDVTCLQSQSLVTMSAKLYISLLRCAGRLDLSAQILHRLQSWARLSQASPKYSQTSLHLAATDRVRHTHEYWHQLKTLLWFRKHQCQKMDWGCWTSTAELFPQQLCTLTNSYSTSWQRRWGWHFLCPSS